MTAAMKSNVSPWLASVYGGVITAIIAVAFDLLFKAEVPALYIIALLLIGIGPVLGFQMARGGLGSDWKSIIGGLIGGIPILGIILWPILVGGMTHGQSIGKLFIGNIVALLLGIAAWALLETLLGGGVNLFEFCVVMGFAVWGGATAAAMTAWGE